MNATLRFDDNVFMEEYHDQVYLCWQEKGVCNTPADVRNGWCTYRLERAGVGSSDCPARSCFLFTLYGLAGRPARGPCPLKVISAKPAGDVYDFTYKV